VHVAFVRSVARWWGCAQPLTREPWRWESSVRSGGDTGYTVTDVMDAVGVVGFTVSFHPSPKKEQNFSSNFVTCFVVLFRFVL
jgi:hypothetical protein